MAGDWIMMQLDLWDCPQVVRMLSALCPQNVRVDAPTLAAPAAQKCRILGALYRTWSIVDQYAEDGNLDGYTADVLDEMVGVAGWAASLQSVGWLIVEPQRLVIPRFEEWFGQSTKRRKLESKRKRQRRNVSAKCPQNVRIDADKTRTREEKRREDIKKETKGKKEAFQKPTVEQVVAYCAERKNGVNAQAWIAHYESNGWKVGKNSMKDWKAAVRTWEENAKPKPAASRVPTAEDLANYNPTDGGQGYA